MTQYLYWCSIPILSWKLDIKCYFFQQTACLWYRYVTSYYRDFQTTETDRLKIELLYYDNYELLQHGGNSNSCATTGNPNSCAMTGNWTPISYSKAEKKYKGFYSQQPLVIHPSIIYPPQMSLFTQITYQDP